MIDFRQAASMIIAVYGRIVLWSVGVVVFLVATLIVLSLLRMPIRRVLLKRSRQKAFDAGRRSDGSPLPPHGRGMCDRCERAFDDVYFMPSGDRLCPACFQIVETSQTACDTASSGKEPTP